MKHIMNLKWCAFTGALMLLFIAATFEHHSVVQDPPGVHTRWWDGTTEMKEIFYPSGKIKSRTTYGEDGSTILTRKEWSPNGLITAELTRRDDGKVYRKEYMPDGKRTLKESLWEPDMMYFLASREYYPNGQLALEETMTEDGTAMTLMRSYDEQGRVTLERRVLDNADQVANQFDDGHIVRREIMKANGDNVSEVFFNGTDVVSVRQTQIRLDGTVITESFNKQGQQLYRRENNAGKGTTSVSRFTNGVMVLRQTLQEADLQTIEQFDPVSGKATRTLSLDTEQNVTAVKLFRADGTVARVKQFKNGVVVHQTDYDSAGLVTADKSGGEPETIDRSLFDMIARPKEE
ncbi:MAG: hypothetical protein JSS86_08350 [Cyanobacteria bacterium SZAS LIN-2]|nr:hypothetical protein [Cyanobacteria bacterium SZAS LIN-2]